MYLAFRRPLSAMCENGAIELLHLMTPAYLPTDRDVRHLPWLDAQVLRQVVEKLVITAGSFSFRRKDGVAVIPLAMLGH